MVFDYFRVRFFFKSKLEKLSNNYLFFNGRTKKACVRSHIFGSSIKKFYKTHRDPFTLRAPTSKTTPFWDLRIIPFEREKNSTHGQLKIILFTTSDMSPIFYGWVFVFISVFINIQFFSWWTSIYTVWACIWQTNFYFVKFSKNKKLYFVLFDNEEITFVEFQIDQNFVILGFIKIEFFFWWKFNIYCMSVYMTDKFLFCSIFEK